MPIHVSHNLRSDNSVSSGQLRCELLLERKAEGPYGPSELSAMAENILDSLNASQKSAVSSSSQSLAILAGPGSGKTHTLTSRTAWLLKQEGYQPWNIIVATFTVKAAREMKERIGKLIGDGMEGKLILGTFHSIARRYLARYGHLIDIPKDFGIADGSDSLAIIKRIVKRHKLTIDPASARSRISGRKAKGANAEAGLGKKVSKSVDAQEFDLCYAEYEAGLKRSNLLDYDDLLLRCVDLLRAHPSCVSNIEAVLIDEFQDTNLVQFDLMRLFAAARKRVTIVGDPDQSIYGFRSAETKNFKRMIRQYPDTVTIPLEENYRSSGSILLAALEVIQQDDSRIAKTLLATHSVGTQPVLRKLPSAHIEAEWVVTELKRCLVLTGNLMDFNDFAILLRSSPLSRHIESALGKAGIPYRMVGGHRFYDRVEVKLLLDYLRVINQPENNDAFARIVNTPARRIGDATVKALLEEADASKTTLWDLSLNIVQGNIIAKTKLAKQAEQGLSSFINIILTARNKISDAAESMSIVEIIEYVMRKISFEDWLKKQYPEEKESEARSANVKELQNLAADFTSQASDGYDDEALPETEVSQQDEVSNSMSRFLANIALASDAKAIDANAAPKAQVTISTIHAAKGLEWPVVFIPAVYEGSIPHSRSEDTDEERRLLYVAMTRAKALLYLSCPSKNSKHEQTTISPFLASKSLRPYLSDRGPKFSSSTTQSIAQILRRPKPSTFDLGARNDGSFRDEDDRWLGDEEDTINEREWAQRNGDHHYTQGQQAVKRQRVDMPEASFVSAATWHPSYATTMAQVSSFTSASATHKSTFVSAGSHMQVLAEQSLSCAAGSSRSSSGNTVFSCKTVVQQVETGNSTRPTSTRPLKQQESQNSMNRFLMNTTTTKLSNSKPKQAPLSKPMPTERGHGNFTNQIKAKANVLPRPLNSTAPIQSLPAISPTLANHRVSTAPYPNAGPRSLNDGAMNRPYSFLSSSPERPKRLLEGVENNQAVPVRPVQTMHVTSMAQLSNGTGTRRTLGVRRSMNGWSGMAGKGFTAPSFTRSRE